MVCCFLVSEFVAYQWYPVLKSSTRTMSPCVYPLYIIHVCLLPVISCQSYLHLCTMISLSVIHFVYCISLDILSESE